MQRCQVHVARNVLAKVPKQFKKAVTDDLMSIFYASSKKKARKFFDQFTDRWRKDLPSEAKCLDTSIDACLTFICLKMELHWRSNPIGKVSNNLPFFKKLALNNFTQLT